MQGYEKYPEMMDSGLEWLGKIPSHWTVKYSKWLFRERKTKASSNDEMLTASQKYGVIPQKLFMELEQQQVVQVQKGHNILKSVDENDFVISMRSFQGGIEYCSYKGSVSSAYVPLIPNHDISVSYYKYLFKSLPYIQALQSTTNLVRDGQALRYSNFIQIYLPLLPFSEANKIGVFLDHEISKIDLLIKEQQQLVNILKEKRKSVISYVVTKGLSSINGTKCTLVNSNVEWIGVIPDSWTVTKIKYIAELTPRKSEVEKEKNKSCSFIPMEKLKTDLLILDETRKISEVFEGYTYFRDEDILMAKVTPCFENSNIVIARDLENGIGFGSTEIYVLRAKFKLLNDYLYYRLQDNVFIDIATSAMTGAGGLKRVSSDFLNNFKIALPPEKERLEIVNYIKQYTSEFDPLIRKAINAIKLMQERRTTIISAAVTGKIDVRNYEIKKQDSNNKSN